MTKQSKLIDFISDFKNAMLVTHVPSGPLHARPMAIAKVEDDGTVWFVTDRHSGKVADLKADDEVAVTMQGGKKFVALTATCEPVDDQLMIDKLFNESWKVWFPGGKTDESLLLLKVMPSEGEFWDNSGLQGAKYMFKAGKAYLAGERPEVDESLNASVSL